MHLHWYVEPGLIKPWELLFYDWIYILLGYDADTNTPPYYMFYL